MNTDVDELLKEADRQFKEVREILKQYFKSNNISNKIEQIKCTIEFLIKPQLNIYEDVPFTNKEISDMVNIATLNYMHIWLENDKKSYQTISDFVKEKAEKTLSDDFKNIFIIDSKTKEDFDEAKYYKTLNRAAYKFKDNIELRKKQAAMEGFQDKRHPNKKNGSDIYSLTQLNFIEFLAHADQNLIDLLFYRKKILEVTSNTRKTDALADAYKNLELILDNLSTTTSNKDFVVACIFFAQLETTYPFIFTAKIAKYMKDNNLDPSKPIPYSIELLIKRIPLKDQNTYFKGIIQPSLYRNCYKIIEKIFNELKNTDNNKKLNSYNLKIQAFRVIIAEVVIRCYKVFPPSQFGSWNETDFNHAASFLINDYCIFDCLELPILDDETKDGNSYYDYIRVLYKNDNYVISQEDFAQSRKYLKEYQVKRNADEKRSHK